MMKFQIKKVDGKVHAEVLEGNKKLFTKSFDITLSMDNIKEQLREATRRFEVEEKRIENIESKKNEFKKLINKKLPL